MRSRLLVMILIAAAAALAWRGCSRNGRPSSEDRPENGTSLPHSRRSATANPFPVAFASKGPKSRSVSLADVASQVTKSVVNVSSTKVIHGHPMSQLPFFNDPLFRRFFGEPGRRQPKRTPDRRQSSLGSGVVISGDGLVLTNHHVVAKADEIRVAFADGSEVAAKVIGSDPRSDIAVLRVKETPEGLEPLPIGNSDALRLGDVVLAVGNPFGVGQTVTMGIVSAKGRADLGIVDYEDFIQTDAAINPGNSGGALVNMKGELIGINTAIISRSGGYQGIGFAIPTNMAKPIMDSLLEHGRVVRGWLGVVIQDLTPALAKGLGIPKSTRGVLISDVAVKSPAAKAGLRRGDVVLSVDRKPVRTTGKLRNLIAGAGANKTVKMTLIRDGKKIERQVKLAELPRSIAQRGPTARPENGPTAQLGGLSLQKLDAQARHQLGLDKDVRGLLIRSVNGGSAAARSGLRPGDVIVEADRRPITSVQTFARLYKAKKGRLLLLVNRRGHTMYVLLEGS